MYKVLIVDDEPLMREGMERVIRKACPDFSRIDSARDGDEALTLALEVVPDVVITDIRMPNMDGLEFIEQLKAEHPDVIVLMVSGFDEFEYAQRGLKLGVKDYLLKPVDSAELAARLNEAAGMLRQKDRESRRFQDLQRLVEENLPLFRERFYRELISGELPPDAIRRRAEALNLIFASKYYGAAIVRLKPAEDTDNQWTQAMLAAITEDRNPILCRSPFLPAPQSRIRPDRRLEREQRQTRLPGDGSVVFATGPSGPEANGDFRENRAGRRPRLDRKCRGLVSAGRGSDGLPFFHEIETADPL